jgi:hypothetical protein
VAVATVASVSFALAHAFTPFCPDMTPVSCLI